jgi:hypothetical protein
VIAFFALLALWIDRQVLNTDNWTDASTEMLAQPSVRNQTAAFLTDELYKNVDVEGEIRAALPPVAQGLAGPAAGFLRGRVEARARKALARQDVQQLWEDANRKAHTLLLQLLDGGTRNVSTEGGAVVLDLKSLLVDLEQRSGVGGKLANQLPASAAQITILQSDQLDTAQNVAKVLDGLPIVLVGLSILLFASALLLAPGYRRRAVRGYGIGLVVAGSLAIAAAAWIGDVLVERLSKTASTEPAIRGVWDIYDTLLLQAATAAVGYGAVIAYGALAAIVLITIVWWAPTPATRNPVTAALLAAFLAVGLEALRRQAAREFPAAVMHQSPSYAAGATNGEAPGARTPESVRVR